MLTKPLTRARGHVFLYVNLRIQYPPSFLIGYSFRIYNKLSLTFLEASG